MNKVIAKGTYFGHEMTIEAFIEDGMLIVLAEGAEIDWIQRDFDERVKHQRPMGGTYYPEPNSLLSAYNVLKHSFFDSKPEITVQGDIGEIPGEENMIY